MKRAEQRTFVYGSDIHKGSWRLVTCDKVMRWNIADITIIDRVDDRPYLASKFGIRGDGCSQECGGGLGCGIIYAIPL
jgi:hypothetical protein